MAQGKRSARKRTPVEEERRNVARAKAESTLDALTAGVKAGILPTNTALAQAFMAGQRYEKETQTP